MFLAIILAANVRNCGMHSVDLAAVDFLTRQGIKFELFCANKIGCHHFGKASQHKINFLSSPKQLKVYSHVIYWGDFTTSPVYGYKNFLNFEKRSKKKKYVPEKLNNYLASRKWRKIFLDYAKHNKDKKVISVGQSFQTLQPWSHIHSLEKLAESYRFFHRIIPRDSNSYSILESGCKLSNLELGMDSAFLLSESNFKSPNKNNVIAYHFGRSNITNKNCLIDRLNTLYNTFELSEWLRLPFADRTAEFNETRTRLLSSSAVITDVYHLAVNAIREHVPVILIGNHADNQLKPVSDFKKRILMEDLGLAEFYFETINNSLGQEQVESIINMLISPKFRDTYENKFENIDRKRSDFSATLVESWTPQHLLDTQ